jgi:hypothetical protein
MESMFGYIGGTREKYATQEQLDFWAWEESAKKLLEENKVAEVNPAYAEMLAEHLSAIEPEKDKENTNASNE